jgi:glucokinase
VAGAPRVGIDIGGTKCLAVALAPDADDGPPVVTAVARRPTPHDADALVDVLAELVAAVAAEAGPPGSVGVGAPGLISVEGVVHSSPNLPGVVELDLAGRLAVRLRRHVAVTNDATCAALAEWRCGAARGVDDVVLVTLGTGIGGGLVSNGRLVLGHNGFAGEVGHMVIDPHGPRCPCGRRGCWERYASGSGMARLAREAASRGELPGVLALVGGDVDAIRGEHVQAAAEAGDPGALAVVDAFARWVAFGLANLANALDPALFVIGGGLTTGAHVYLEPIQRAFGPLLYASHLRPHPPVRFAELGEQAGAIGAALLPEATAHQTG